MRVAVLVAGTFIVAILTHTSAIRPSPGISLMWCKELSWRISALKLGLTPIVVTVTAESFSPGPSGGISKPVDATVPVDLDSTCSHQSKKFLHVRILD